MSSMSFGEDNLSLNVVARANGGEVILLLLAIVTLNLEAMNNKKGKALSASAVMSDLIKKLHPLKLVANGPMKAEKKKVVTTEDGEEKSVDTNDGDREDSMLRATSEENQELSTITNITDLIDKFKQLKVCDEGRETEDNKHSEEEVADKGKDVEVEANDEDAKTPSGDHLTSGDTLPEEDYKRYLHCCQHIEDQIKTKTGIALPSGSNISFQDYLQLRDYLDAQGELGSIELLFRPQVLVVSSTSATNTIDAQQQAGHRAEADVEAVQVNNEEIFIYPNKLIVDFDRQAS